MLMNLEYMTPEFRENLNKHLEESKVEGQDEN